MQTNKSIIVISKFETSLDNIEDIMTTKAFIIPRFTDDDAESESGLEIFHVDIAFVFLYYHKQNSTFDAPLNVIETTVILESPLATWSRIQRFHRVGRTPVSNIAITYCGDVVEPDHSKPDDTKFERNYLAVSLHSSIPPLLPSATNLISQASSSVRMLSKQLY